MHLTDSFAPVMSYLVQFQHNAEENLLRAEQLRAEIDHLLRQGEEAAARAGIRKETFDAARFAVCAWGDEVILNSAWSDRSEWLKEELQRHYYGTSDAGEGFFERLKALPLHEQEVREIFYLCLCLGFTGRYCGPGGEEALSALRTDQLKLLSGTSTLEVTEERDLFPGGYPQDLPAPRKVGSWTLRLLPSLPALAIPVLFFVVLLVVFRLALAGMAQNLLKGVPF